MARKPKKEVKRRNTQVVEPIRDKKDIKRVINYFNNNNKHKYAVIFILGINSGLRISDILNLKVSQVLNQSFIKLKEQKTNKAKQFPLKQELQILLNDFCKGKELTEYLFTSKSEKKLDRIMVYKQLVKACSDLGIEGNYGTHTCRKTMGYHHYKQFKDIALLQTIFNHSTPEVTKRYIGITQDEINESYLALSFEPEISVEEIKKPSKIRARRVESFLNNYIKNGGKTHRDFAQTILELMS